MTKKQVADYKKYIQVHYGSQYKKILLVTEEHTNNPYYVENVWTIKNLLEQADYKVEVAFPKSLDASLELTSITGKKLTVHSGFEPTH